MSDETEPRRGSITREGGFAVVRLPIEEVHGLCVALEPCPCRSSKSNSTAEIRARLARGLILLLAKGKP